MIFSYIKTILCLTYIICKDYHITSSFLLKSKH